jgi:hypothetical protein
VSSSAKIIAAELIAKHGAGAHGQAIAMAEATGMYGSLECADFYYGIARMVALLAVEPVQSTAGSNARD